MEETPRNKCAKCGLSKCFIRCLSCDGKGSIAEYVTYETVTYDLLRERSRPRSVLEHRECAECKGKARHYACPNCFRREHRKYVGVW